MNINVTIRVLPFGSYEFQDTLRIGPAQPIQREQEPVVLEPTTIADHVITSAPAQLLAA